MTVHQLQAGLVYMRILTFSIVNIAFNTGKESVQCSVILIVSNQRFEDLLFTCVLTSVRGLGYDWKNSM